MRNLRKLIGLRKGESLLEISKEMKDRVDSIYVEFNQDRFVKEILEADFKGRIDKCAKAIGVSNQFMNSLIYTEHKVGKINLTRILRYCVRTNRDPLRFITKLGKECEFV